MKRISRTWAVRAGALAAVVAAGLAGTVSAQQASAATESADHGRPPGGGGGAGAPAIIRPPAGATFLGEFRVVTGAQVYQCTAGAWTFKAPEATLAGRRGHQIHHFAGPSWQSVTDGSLVTATKVAEAPSAVPGSIPQLLLKVATHSGSATGELATATYIQRLRTRGGTAPTGACTDGATQAVSYNAEYVFYANG